MCTFRTWIISATVLIGLGLICGVVYILIIPKMHNARPNQDTEDIFDWQRKRVYQNLDASSEAKSAPFVISRENISNHADDQYISYRHRMKLEYDQEIKNRQEIVKSQTNQLLSNIFDLRKKFPRVNSLVKWTEFIGELDKLENRTKEIQNTADADGDDRQYWLTASNLIKMHVEIRKIEIDINEVHSQIKQKIESEEIQIRENVTKRIDDLLVEFNKLTAYAAELKPSNARVEYELKVIIEKLIQLQKKLQIINQNTFVEFSFSKIISELNFKIKQVENAMDMTKENIQNLLKLQNQANNKQKIESTKEELIDLLKTVLQIQFNASKLEHWPGRMDFFSKIISLKNEINNALHFVSSTNNTYSFQSETWSATVQKLRSGAMEANQYLINIHKVQEEARELKKSREKEHAVQDIILALKIRNPEKAGAVLNQGLTSGLILDEDIKRIVVSVYSGDLKNYDILDTLDNEHLDGIENGILLYEALFNELVKHNQTYSTEMVRLGHRIKQYEEYPDYEEIENEYKNIFSSLFSKLPTCIRNLLSASVCLKGDIRGYARTALHSKDLDSADLLKSSSWNFITKNGGKSFAVKNNYDNLYMYVDALGDVYMASTGTEWLVEPKNDKDIQLWDGENILQIKLSDEYSKSYGYTYRFYVSSQSDKMGSYWEVQPY